MPHDNSKSNRNGVNIVRGNKKPEWVAQKSEKRIVSQIRCFNCKMLNHRRSECSKLQSRSNNCARVRLKGQRIRDNQFVILLYVNDQMVDGYRDLGAAISLAYSKIVETGDYLPHHSGKLQVIQGGLSEIPLAKIFVNSPRFCTNENVKIMVDV